MDPYPFGTKMGSGEESLLVQVPEEFPETPALALTVTGSFDCAQDDNLQEK